MEKYTINKFNLLKLSTFFTSSCKTQNLCEVIDHSKNPIFTPQKPFFLQTPLLENIHDNEVKQEVQKYPFGNFVFKPPKIVGENYMNAPTGNTISRRKVVEKNSIFDDVSGGRCPPGSPVSPLFRKQGKKNKKKKNEKFKNNEKIKHFENNNYGMKNGFSSSNETDDKGDWFSSDDEREYYERQTMFSLKSLSFSSQSDNVIIQTRKKTQVQTQTRKMAKSSSFPSKSFSFSSDSEKAVNQSQTRKKIKSLSFSQKSNSFSFDSENLGNQTQTQPQTREKTKPRRRKSGSRVREVGVVPLEGKVKDTFAIVKRSSDPHDDFKKSMVEMIIEKQIFCAKELEQLLDCFIHLNSSCHHRVIVEAFIEICDALFSHCS